MQAAPDMWRYRFELAMTLRAVGSIYRQQDSPADALPAVDAAVMLFTNLCTERPDDPAMHVDLAQTFRLLASVQIALTQSQQALDAFAKCRQAWQRAKNLDAGMSDQNLKLLGHACFDEGELAMTVRRHDVARVALVDGIAAFDAASRRGRMNTTDDLDWAGCHVFLGFQQAAADDVDAAIQSYETAIRILEPRVARSNVNKRLKELHRRCVKRVEELKAKQSAAETATANKP